MKFKLPIVLLLVLIVGAFLRLYGLGAIPASLYWDEIAIGVDAYAVSVWGKDMHGNSAIQAMYPSYGDYKLPLYILIDSLVIKFFGLTPWSVRLPSALAGIGLIYVTHLLAKQVFKSQKAGVISALIMALLPVEILFSRTGFEGHLAVLFVAFSLYLWLKSFKHPSWLFLASISSALAVYSYFSARIVIPLMGAVTLLSFFKRTSLKWKAFFILSFGFWALLLLPISNSPFYESSNQFRLSTKNLLDVGQFAIESNEYREQSGNFLISRIVYHRYLLQTKAVAVNVAKHFDPQFLFFNGDMNLRHSTRTTGLLYVSLLPLFVLGWWKLFRRDTHIAFWLFGLWLASIVPAAIPLEVPHALRSLNSVIVLALVTGFGAYWLSKKQTPLMFLFSFLLLFETGFFIHDYAVHYPLRSAESWQDGYFQLADYLKQNYENFDQVRIDYPDGRLYLYFLFANQTHPSTISQYADNYIISEWDKYRFEPVDEVPTNDRVWLVTNTDKWRLLGEPPATFIYRGNDELFAVVNGNKDL